MGKQRGKAGRTQIMKLNTQHQKAFRLGGQQAHEALLKLRDEMQARMEGSRVKKSVTKPASRQPGRPQ